MASQDRELDDLFRDDHLEGTDKRRQSGRTTIGVGRERSIHRSQHGGVTITLRIKPDRRCVITPIDPKDERRRR